MKNIIFITYLNLWSMDKGKGAPSFYKTIDAYIKSGWNVTLINPNYDVGMTPQIDRLNNLTFKPIFVPWLKVKRLSFFGRILHSIQGDYCLYQLGKKAINKYSGSAIVYAYEVNGVKAGKKLSKIFNLPFITRFQGTILAPINDSWINRLKKYPHFGAISTNADITIMTDDGTQGDIVLKRLKNNSDVVKFWRNGVDVLNTNTMSLDKIHMLRQKLQLKESDKILLTVSRLASWKRVDRAITALSIISRNHDNVKLVVVGDGEEKENLKKLAGQLDVIKNVRFVGAIEQLEVRNYLEIADIFLSLYDLSNVGNPLLEAMTCGKPIITLDVGDTRLLIKNNFNGILLDTSDLDSLPTKILSLLDDSKFADMLGDNAKEFAEKEFWSWDDRMNAEINLVTDLYDRYYNIN